MMTWLSWTTEFDYAVSMNILSWPWCKHQNVSLLANWYSERQSSICAQEYIMKMPVCCATTLHKVLTESFVHCAPQAVKNKQSLLVVDSIIDNIVTASFQLLLKFSMIDNKPHNICPPDILWGPIYFIASAWSPPLVYRQSWCWKILIRHIRP